MRFLIIIGLILITATQSFGWAEKGHAIVADVAAAGLSPQAKAHVDRLLQGKTMAQVSSWADEMRTWQRHRSGVPPHALADDPEALDFLQNDNNDDQPSWHFVDLPLGARRYKLGDTGTRPDDIVQVIDRCIAVLKGHPHSGESMDQPQALRILIHLVGDLHQPLHASCGYWLAGPDGRAILATPSQAAVAIDDHGANSLKLGTGRDNFHYLWDGHMVTIAQNGQTSAQYVHHLVGMVGGSTRKAWKLAGKPENWAAQWAAESAAAAAVIYKPLDFSQLTVDKTRKQIKGIISLPPGYDTKFIPTVNICLARAGYRLAALLNTIYSH